MPKKPTRYPVNEKLAELSSILDKIKSPATYKSMELETVLMVQKEIAKYKKLAAEIGAYKELNVPKAGEHNPKVRLEQFNAQFNRNKGEIGRENQTRVDHYNGIAVKKKTVEAELLNVRQAKGAYMEARLENKDALLAEYKRQSKALDEIIKTLPSQDRGQYVVQLTELSKEVNVRTQLLAKQEAQIKAEIVLVAKKAEQIVDGMNVQEQILSLASPQVKKAVTTMLSKLTQGEMVGLLTAASDDDSNELALVSTALSDVVATTGKKSVVGKELAAITDLSVEEQGKLVQAIFSGQLSVSDMSSTTQMAVMAAVINQLATKTGMKKEDRLAVQEFTSGIVTMMDQVAKKEADALTILFEVDNAFGKKELRSFHIDLNLLRNPVNLASVLSFELLKAGASPNTPIMTAVTSMEQRGALSLLQGKTMEQLAIQGKSLLQIASMAISDTRSLKQITGNDVSEGALVRAGRNTSLVSSGGGVVIGGGKHQVKDDFDMLTNLIRGLAIVNETVRQVVLTSDSAFRLKFTGGISPAIGAKPMLMLTSGAQLLTADDSSLMLTSGDGLGHSMAAAAAHQETLTSPEPDDAHVDATLDATVGVDTHDKGAVSTHSAKAVVKEVPVSTTVIANPHKSLSKPAKTDPLVVGFNAAVEQLESLYSRVKTKYGKDSKIASGCKDLLSDLDKALVKYEETGNRQLFKATCDAAVNNVRNEFNTHRDSFIKRVIGHIADAVSSFISSIFSSNKEEKEHKASRATFFGNTGTRETESAQVLYKFKTDLDAVAKVADLEEEHDQQHGLGGHGLGGHG